tara:strand:- start:66 stop:410 length:345 start_codon:yes stop_codon:yes gene_type:complete
MEENKDEIIPNNRETQEEAEYGQGMHPNSLKALKKNQFPKGVSGNVMGKPMKFDAMANALNELGDEFATKYMANGKEDVTKRRVVLEKCWDRAMRGEIAFIKMLAFLGCLDNKD